MEEERIKYLAELRKKLERRIEELSAELELLKECAKVIDEVLARASFKPAISIAEEIERPPEEEYSIKSRINGRTLAVMYVWKDKVKIVPAEGMKIDVNKPPFNTFFIRRVLDTFRQRDLEEVRRGRLDADQVLDYTIKTDDEGMLKELIVHNYREMRRLRELRSSLRWTLERMEEGRRTR
ncbi:MAG: hypothetical protein DRN15_01685 [Thermoprotei archaeon]|nr:MAG: hypothetical protein DRM97_08550 [Thermoprotei archaeon]RLF24675.1 MAG: hypothetical protein DRN15_01685 [Thermoprotei archaeon]